MKNIIVSTIEFFYWLLSIALNIFIVIRKWTVSYGSWHGGQFECFWLRRNAIRFAQSRSEIFVSIRHEINGKSIWIRNNPDNQQPPIMYV